MGEVLVSSARQGRGGPGSLCEGWSQGAVWVRLAVVPSSGTF